MPFGFLDPTILLLIPAFIFALVAQGKVKGAYKKFSRMRNQSGLTGADAARRILRNHGITDVEVEPSRGMLSDHYDPTKKKVRLSEENYNKSTVAALAIAAHEVGHAIQHHESYSFLKFRHALAGPVNIGSWGAFPLFIIGFIFASPTLVDIGIFLFLGVVLFHLITLPVEFDASKRAMAILRTDGYVQPQESDGAKKMLNAAAMTYVASATMAIVELVRLLILRGMMEE
ncbi:peptidase [bacterium]|nr:peptidase [bacterium]